MTTPAGSACATTHPNPTRVIGKQLPADLVIQLPAEVRQCPVWASALWASALGSEDQRANIRVHARWPVDETAHVLASRAICFMLAGQSGWSSSELNLQLNSLPIQPQARPET